MPDRKPRVRSTAYALAYATALPLLRRIAREHGYALAVHGSMCTDLDLVAIPWVEEAVPAKSLAEALRDAVGGVFGSIGKPDYNPAWKPHGRLAWTIYTRAGGNVYIDLSVMPRRRDGEHYDNEDLRAIEEKFAAVGETEEQGCQH